MRHVQKFHEGKNVSEIQSEYDQDILDDTANTEPNTEFVQDGTYEYGSEIQSEYDTDFVDGTTNTEPSTEYVYEAYEDESEIQSGYDQRYDQGYDQRYDQGYDQGYDQDVLDGTEYTEPSTELVDGTNENG